MTKEDKEQTTIKEKTKTPSHQKTLFLAEAETYTGTSKIINLVIQFKFNHEELEKLIKEIRKTKKLKAKFFLK